MKVCKVDSSNYTFTVTSEDCENGIIIELSKEDFENGTVNLKLVLENETESSSADLKKEEEPTIPGHPNCHYGECWDCLVQECAIKQGYEPIPEFPGSDD